MPTSCPAKPWAGGERVTHRATSREFIAFLEPLVAGYRTAPVIALVLDNVVIHGSQAVQVWLREQPRVQLLCGARYSPHANPVERVWAVLKPQLANSAPTTMAGRLRQASRFFDGLRPDDFLRIAAADSAPLLPATWRQDL